MQKNWAIKDLLEWTTRYFTQKGIKQPRLETEILLARVLKKDRVYLYAHYDAPVNQNERDQFREWIKRRIQGEPVAYITGFKEFMSLELRVNPAVLIPRPDTEILVEEVINLAKFLPAKICDVGTGSGAIAVSLAYYLTNVQVFASDISFEALEIARENARLHKVEIQFSQGDLLEPVKAAAPFDIIVANLPYISESEYRSLDPGIINYEPTAALLASGDGLDIYRRLLPQAEALLNPGGYLVWEIGSSQGEKALSMMQGFSEVEIIKDLAGHDRVVRGRKNENGDHIFKG